LPTVNATLGLSQVEERVWILNEGSIERIGVDPNYARTSSIKQITPPALIEVRSRTTTFEGKESDLVFDVTDKCLKLLLELTPNAGTGHDS
jgi:hypothetical protein